MRIAGALHTCKVTVQRRITLQMRQLQRYLKRPRGTKYVGLLNYVPKLDGIRTQHLFGFE